jgi:NAD+ diphosphatase
VCPWTPCKGALSLSEHMKSAVERLRSSVIAACTKRRPEPCYAGSHLVRPLDSKLEDALWLAAAERESSAVILLDLKKNAVAVNSAGGLAYASAAQAREIGVDEMILLGRRKPHAMPPSFLNERYAKTASDTMCFAASIQDPDGVARAVHGVSRFVGLRDIVGRASSAEAAMVGQARNVLHWHRSHTFCGACGSRSEPKKGGWKRLCPSCGTQHFPRTDPVVISAVLSADGTRCLVGRQALWPKGRFSCLAGFLDPGETLEEGVRREVREESGVLVGDVIYHSSQPWPNGPSPQLMLGAVAIAHTEALIIDTSELESARWVELAEVREALRAAAARPPATDGELLMPQPLALAHQLLTTCTELEGGGS